MTEFVGLYGKLHASVEQVAIVCGGGNIRRWRDTRSMNIPRVRSDALGITATVMNAVVLANALTHAGYKAVAMSPGAYHLPSLCDRYDVNIAKAYLEAGTIVVFGGGTSNPFSTTDSGAVLRALELECDAMIKATTVDGVYSADPNLDTNAVRYETLTYQDAIQQGIKVMDMTAFCMAQEHDLSIYVTSKAGLQTFGTPDFIGTHVYAQNRE